MRVLCKLGIHKWSLREVHITAPILDKHTIQASIIERCECGESRFAIGGGNKMTQFFYPEKYIEERK